MAIRGRTMRRNSERDVRRGIAFVGLPARTMVCDLGVVCPHCGAAFYVARTALKARCPSCRTVVRSSRSVAEPMTIDL